MSSNDWQNDSEWRELYDDYLPEYSNVVIEAGCAAVAAYKRTLKTRIEEMADYNGTTPPRWDEAGHTLLRVLAVLEDSP